jgi:hypothetical protein
MSENAINFIIEEVCITKKKFADLQKQPFAPQVTDLNDYTRSIYYDFNGHNYQIRQYSNSTLAPRKTWFYRNSKMHRLDGPAFYYEGSADFQRFHCAGHQYAENEFNFFVLGMIT